MKNKLTEEMGLRLRSARRAAGYKSARAFAIQHGISQSTYSQHETGKRSLVSKALLRYCQLFRISPAWLLTGKAEHSIIETAEAD
jgi:transcriptional regulator with XRE-family HTH domain